MTQEPIIFELDEFTYDKGTRTLSAEVSSFYDYLGDVHGFIGAPDEFMVHSPKTGKYCLFRRPTEVRDRDNDITQWEYYSAAERVKLILWND